MQIYLKLGFCFPVQVKTPLLSLTGKCIYIYIRTHTHIHMFIQLNYLLNKKNVAQETHTGLPL